MKKLYFIFALLLATAPLSAYADLQQASSNQVYADCMRNSWATASACQESASQQTGVAPTNTEIRAGQQTDALGNPLPGNTNTNTNTNTGGGAQQINPNSICNGKTCTYTPLEPIPGLPQSGSDFAGFLNGMFKLLFTIGGMVAVASLVYGGITYMVSEIVGKIEWAKRQMREALWGLALLVAAWLILYTINPDLITFKLNVQSITTNTPTSAANTTATAPPSAQTLNQNGGLINATNALVI